MYNLCAWRYVYSDMFLQLLWICSFTNHTVTILKHLMLGFHCSISMSRIHLCLYASIWVWRIPPYVNTPLMLCSISVFCYLWIVKWKWSHIANRTFYLSVSEQWKQPSKMLRLRSLQICYTAAFPFSSILLIKKKRLNLIRTHFLKCSVIFIILSNVIIHK